MPFEEWCQDMDHVLENCVAHTCFVLSHISHASITVEFFFFQKTMPAWQRPKDSVVATDVQMFETIREELSIFVFLSRTDSGQGRPTCSLA